MIEKKLIILPGWGGSHKTWVDFVDLAKNYFQEVEVIDLPCFGDEPCPNSVWGIEEYSNFVKSKIKNQKSKIILGHSFGGAVALNLASKNPELIEKLILSGASVFRPKKTVRRLFFKCLAKCGKWIFSLPLIERFDILAKKMLYRVADSPDYSKTSGIKREIFKKIIKEDQSKHLSGIKMPTLVVWGSKDVFVPLEHGKQIKKLIPNSKLVIFQGGKHGLHLQQPEELLNTIKIFSI